MNEPAKASRCGFVALVGAPNVGKSTLLNTLVGSKVSIVSPKVQTTRARITAIAVEGASQLVFVDTPGIFTKVNHRLEKAMVAAAWSGAEDADAVVVLVDAERGIDRNTGAILDGLSQRKRRTYLALNKIDLVKPQVLLGLTEALHGRASFTETFMISALTGAGVADLRAALATAVPEGPWHYPEDQLADIPSRMLAAEITREQTRFPFGVSKIFKSDLIETNRIAVWLKCQLHLGTVNPAFFVIVSPYEIPLRALH